ncbi:hypothetical protein SAY87_015872 [Trapa incisa]|uniref:Uncharacterized protein n=1 Tax=Trapa incisa TaxID=236973 RepID=A0AAN7LFP4_9MYRT|nr:hypothetical protein SAY87_015872 [Trapa incisa]
MASSDSSPAFPIPCSKSRTWPDPQPSTPRPLAITSAGSTTPTDQFGVMRLNRSHACIYNGCVRRWGELESGHTTIAFTPIH